MKKILTSLLSGLLVISCSNTANVNNTNEKFKIPIEKVNFKLSEHTTMQPKMLTFESKVPIKSLKMVKELPDGKNFKFSFEVNPKKINKNTIKIPLNGNFKLTIKKGTKFSVIDNDGTDGNATIEIPENAVNYFLGVPDKDDDKKIPSIGKITVEDKLYYIKQEIKQLTKKEREAIFEKEKKENEHKKESENKKESDDKKFDTKDSKDDKNDKDNKENENNGTWYTGEKEDGTWYKLGKRALNVPSEWKTDNGNNYVLNLTNEGLSNFILRGYKTSNVNDFEYPDGVNLIGVKGGTVELTGVAKIEIAKNALDKDTFISITQQLEEPEILDWEGNKLDDYVGPVIKIEPVGLILKGNDWSKLYLGTDLKRLGSNTPAITRCEYFKDERGDMLGYISKDFSDITINSPALLTKLGYIRKVIPVSVLPDFGTEVSTIDEPTPSSNFKIQSVSPLLTEVISALTYYFHSSTPHFAFFTSKYAGMPEGIIEEIKARAELAYSHNASVLNSIEPDTWLSRPDEITKQNKLYIPIYFFGHLTQGGEKAVVALNKKSESEKFVRDQIYLPDESSVEHEIWHLFQHKIIINQGLNYNDFVGGSGKYKWVEESTAEYVGARTFKYYKDKFVNSTYLQSVYNNPAIPSNYTGKISDGLKFLELAKSLPYETEKYTEGHPKRDNYMETLFFSYLANDNIDGVSIVKTIFKDLNSNYSHLERFHDFALNSKLENFFNIKFDNYARSHTISSHNFLLKDESSSIILNSENPEIILSGGINNNKKTTNVTLENNSAKYLFFSTTYNKTIPSLGLKIKVDNSSCGSGGTTKARILFYDSANNPIILPQYLDDNNPNIIDSSVSSLFTDKAFNLDTTLGTTGNKDKLYGFYGFGRDFSKAVLIISNSNGQLTGGNTCKYSVESCLYCV